jgi:hypothetical protein
VGFLLFTSYSHALPLPEAAALDGNASVHLPLDDRDDRINWVGRRFAMTREDGHDDGYQKSLLSARHIYFTGFHLPGACTARRAPDSDWGRLLRDDDFEFAFYAKRVAKEDAAVFHFRVVLKPITYVRSKVSQCVGVSRTRLPSRDVHTKTHDHSSNHHNHARHPSHHNHDCNIGLGGLGVRAELLRRCPPADPAAGARAALGSVQDPLQALP